MDCPRRPADAPFHRLVEASFDDRIATAALATLPVLAESAAVSPGGAARATEEKRSSLGGVEIGQDQRAVLAELEPRVVCNLPRVPIGV